MTGRIVSHFRVLEKLGSGGMGVVFEAEDIKLGRKVAIKFLPNIVPAKRETIERFEREARSASALNHPNICTVYEIDTFDGQPFIAMELLQGQTLSDRLQQGAIAIPDLLRLGIEVADALDAAHSHGIVHRDIKPGNLFMTTRGIGKVLDFGLAKLESIEPVGDEASDDAGEEFNTVTVAPALTEPGLVIGTVAYMSPEQARGEPLDARTDLFSLGVVLYEMAGGRQPFRAGSNVAVLAALLHQTPEAPSSLNATVPPALDRIIQKALEKDRRLRYQTAAHLRDDLTSLLQAMESGVALARRPWLKKAVAGAAIALVLAGGAVALRLARRPQSIPFTPAAPAKQTRRSIAVLGFKNLSGRPDAAWLSTAISEMLSTELGVGEHLRIISGENVFRNKVDLSLSDVAAYSKDTLARIKKGLGTDLVVLGSYTDLGAAAGGQLRLDLRLQDAASGEILAALADTGTEAKLFELVTLAGSQLREKLGIAGISENDGTGVRASLPADPAIARLYSEGLKRQRQFDFLGARDLFEKVVAAEPDYALGHSALSSADSALGFDAKSRTEAKEAFRLSVSLPRENRLNVEGRFWETQREWEKAVGVYESLCKLFPDNVDYGLRLAQAQMQAGKAKNALVTLAALRQSPPARDDARIDLAEATANAALGNFQKQIDAALVADQKSEDARLLRARARTMEGTGLSRLGKLKQAQDLLEESRVLYEAAGYKQGTARAMLSLGSVLLDKGEWNQAREIFESALKIFRQIGDRDGTANALNNLANGLYDAGDLPAARSSYEQSLAIYREVDSKAGIAGALGNIANVSDGEGDLAGARQRNEQALAAFREVGDARGASSTLRNLGDVLFEQGELAESRRIQEESLSERRKMGYDRGIAYSLESLGQVLRAQGDLPDARKDFAEAMALQTRIEQRAAMAATSLEFSALCIDEGKFEEAQRLARSSVEEFTREKQPENQSLGAVVLARSFLAQNNLPAAQQSIARARSLMPKVVSLPSSFELGITSARIQTAARNTSGARVELNKVLDAATKHGFQGFALEARLALCETEAAERQADAPSALALLQKDAAQKGFGLIAKKAAALAHHT